MIAVAFLMSTGCKEKMLEKSELKREFALKDLDARIVKESNRVGLSLYSDISRKKPDENIFLSPLSISTALALTYSGASGETATEMRKSLGFDKLTNEQIGHGYRVLLDLLSHSQDDGIGLDIANSLWMREGVPFHDSYVQQSRIDYSAEANQLDFNSSNAAKKMNNWVERHTDGHIKEMVKEISSNSVLYLLNAVFFEGAWTEPFRPEGTNRAKFHLIDADAITVEMMSKSGHYEYAQKDGYEAVRLPFGKDESASMVIFLPAPRSGALRSLQEKLAADPALVTEPFDLRSGRVDLPKMKIEYSVNLNEDLNGLGMGIAFDPIRADFSRMAPEPPNLYISKVEHKTTLDINEQGASAAAATKVEMMAGAAQPENPFHIALNRPFILSIVDRDTGTILFVGTIVNPLG